MPSGIASAETRLLELPAARPGQTVHLRAITTESERCTLRVAGRTRSLAVAGYTRSRFTLSLSRRARPGGYRVRLRCRSASDRTTLRVAGPRPRASRRRIVVGLIRARAYRRPVQPADARVTAIWREEKPWFEAAFESVGDHVTWAYARRPDIVEAAERRNIADGLNDRAAAAGRAVTTWETYAWDENAVSGGLVVSGFPRAGALMVWHRSAVDADLAYVEAVLPDGSVSVSEMGAPGVPLRTVTRRTISPAQLGAAPEVVYILRAGDTGL